VVPSPRRLASASFAVDLAKEGAEAHPERGGDPVQVHEAHVPLAALRVSDIGAVHPDEVREGLL
jgi:hypothetical protein